MNFRNIIQNKEHIFFVFALILIFAVIGILADSLLKPKSFDEYGHYRWDAVNEIASKKIVIQNRDTCKACHEDIYLLNQKDAHYNVQCVDCHGAGDKHVEFHRHGAESKDISADDAMLEKDYKLEGCLYCHRKLKARPSDFPQISKDEHYKFLNVTSNYTNCTECHSPHEPLFLLTEARESRLHPIVYRCGDCHSKPVGKSFKDVANHPKIFECKDCHAELTADFNKRPHSKAIDCRTCHLFKKESETIGRIYKNGNARFCMLCHESKPFKNPTYPPKIKWPKHIEKLNLSLFRFASEENIETSEPKICLTCHREQIHKVESRNSTVVSSEQQDVTKPHFHGEESGNKGNDNPHPFNWKMQHKKFAITKSGKMNASCNFCHQQSFCNSCHKVSLPHTDDFKMGGHSTLVKEKGRKLCQSCHKQEVCKQCHD